jgi:hypothetical protein
MCQLEDVRNAKRSDSPTDISKGEDIAAQIMKQINEEEDGPVNTRINE